MTGIRKWKIQLISFIKLR